MPPGNAYAIKGLREQSTNAASGIGIDTVIVPWIVCSGLERRVAAYETAKEICIVRSDNVTGSVASQNGFAFCVGFTGVAITECWLRLLP